MADLPQAVLAYLEGAFYRARSLAWLVVNTDGSLIEAGGELEAHEIPGLEPGSDVTAAIPVLHGLLPAGLEPLVLTAIEARNYRFFDLHIFPQSGRDWVLLMDSTAENLLRRQTETALRTREEQLRHAQKMETLGRLAGGVAHDFNNLLTVIIGYSQFLQDDLGTEDPRSSAAAQIRGAAERCGRLTSQLLAFSRKQLTTYRVLNLNSVLSELEHMLRKLLGENIALELQLDPGLALVKADAGQLEQVIVNLAVNARDAMGSQGGLLRIVTEDVEHEGVSSVMLAISDTGHGMSRETQAHIFEPFFTTKGPSKGTGLGLATVYGIVDQAGGNISVESELGQGTTFRIYLPQTGEPPESADQNSTGSLAAATETLLVVEDEMGVRDLVYDVLRRHGYRVLQAGDADEALRLSALESGPIHLLVTDIMLPGITGNELAGILRAQRPGLRVLLLSGYAPAAMRMEGEACFLAKPFTREALIRKTREALEAPVS